jgi:hypothetical protein
VYVNEDMKGFEIKERDLQHYLVRMAHPLRHSQLFAGWPGILRKAAELIEERKI